MRVYGGPNVEASTTGPKGGCYRLQLKANFGLGVAVFGRITATITTIMAAAVAVAVAV